MKLFSLFARNKSGTGHRTSLTNPVVVTSLDEEYQYLRFQRCSSCRGKIESRQGQQERLSWVLYKGRVHDILRCHCADCGAAEDFCFDFTNTVEDPAIIPFCVEVRIDDPVPQDVFASVDPRFIRKPGEGKLVR